MTTTPLGRATTIPATDSPSGTALTLGCYDTDAAHTTTTGTGAAAVTTTHTLDPAGRRLQATTTPTAGTATSTAVRHYTDGSDNPGWIADTTTGTETRYTESLGGDLAAQITTTGTTTTATLTLVDLHGDITATTTIPATGNATGISSWSDTTEYGLPRTGTTTPTDPARYNWLGGKQRATDTTGLLLMGARLYNPTTGRFASVDPESGGNENAYNYPNDPIGMVDLDGRWGMPSWGAVRNFVKTTGWISPLPPRALYRSRPRWLGPTAAIESRVPPTAFTSGRALSGSARGLSRVMAVSIESLSPTARGDGTMTLLARGMAAFQLPTRCGSPGMLVRRTAGVSRNVKRGQWAIVTWHVWHGISGGGRYAVIQGTRFVGGWK